MRKITLDDYIKERLKDLLFKREWGRSEVQYQITRQLIAERLRQNLSQRKLAEKAKTTQAVISRIERIAQTLGLSLQINLVSQ